MDRSRGMHIGNEGRRIQIRTSLNTIGWQRWHPTDVAVESRTIRGARHAERIPAGRPTSGGKLNIRTTARGRIQIRVYRVSSEIRSRTSQDYRDGLCERGTEIDAWLLQHAPGKGKRAHAWRRDGGNGDGGILPRIDGRSRQRRAVGPPEHVIRRALRSQ